MAALLRRDCAVSTSARYGDERWEMLFPQVVCAMRCGVVPRSVSQWGRSGGLGATKRLARHGRRLTACRWRRGAAAQCRQAKICVGRRGEKSLWIRTVGMQGKYGCLLRTNVGLMLCPPDRMRRTLPRTRTPLAWLHVSGCTPQPRWPGSSGEGFATPRSLWGLLSG